MKIAIICGSNGIGNQQLKSALLRKPVNPNISDGSSGKQMVKYKLTTHP